MILREKSVLRLLSVAILTLIMSACSSSSSDTPPSMDSENPPNTDSENPPNTDSEEPPNTGSEDVPPVSCDAAAGMPLADATEAPIFAFAAARAPDFSAGRLVRISVGDNPSLSGCTLGTLSDISVATDGTSAYEIGRFNLDTITQFNIESLAANYQYSVAGTGPTVNPHDIAFLNDNKAYVARYGSTALWAVNPSATTDTDFFLSEIDLSAYDADGATEMTDALIVDGKLFVLMQRLQAFSPTLDGYVAVIDTTNDTEINTGQGTDGLNGIRLDVRNPSRLFFNAATNDVMVVAAGDNNGSGDLAARLTGGLVAIDANDYSSELVIDDDVLNPAPADGEEQTPLFVFDAIIASADKGYLVASEAFRTSSIHAFNPTTGVVEAEPLPGLAGIDITLVENGPNGNVWVGVGNDAPGFLRLNPADDSQVGTKILTELEPLRVVFINR